MRKLILNILVFFKKLFRPGSRGEAFFQFWIDKIEIVVYLVVGVLTTIVSWAAKFAFNFVFYAGTAHPTSVQNFILSAVNWIAGVAFAYPTNRAWVFESKDPKILPECTKFVLSRVSTLVLDIVVMQVLGALGMNLYAATLISAVLVIIGNYVFSKLFVFKAQKK
ncbi:MAG: GtrA family protein [Eubacteriales bacterium]|nr:GtrA family protein [Eubacteriales bacterium]